MRAEAEIKVEENNIICDVNPKMYGVFFEEINHAGDGGLYGEMVRNRSFMDSVIPEGTAYFDGKAMTKTTHVENFDTEDLLPGWSLDCGEEGEGTIEPWLLQPRNKQTPNQIKMTVSKINGCFPKLVNSGFWGMKVRCEKYRAVLILRSEGVGNVRISLEKDGMLLGEAIVENIGINFKKYTVQINCVEEVSGVVLTLTPLNTGTLYLDFVSLFPVNTYKNRENGMRRDLAEALEKLKPGFFRFPGGCIVEGISLENAYRFHKTIGPVEDRTGTYNLWGYRRTDGMGFYEFLQFCEDIGADAMYVCNCGMSCQARKSEEGTEKQLAEFLQDTMDAIEYAIGDPETTKWGKLRAEHGHSESFPLKYIEIGNENGGPFYQKAYRFFYERLKARYPQLLYIINDATGIERTEYDFLDEHYYCEPAFFAAVAEKYDTYSRDRKIYVGEYACNTGVGIGNMAAAASEAVFMISMEKNADVVKMASYAPLFCNVNDRVWPVNLINYDSDRWFGIPSYHLQCLFRKLLSEKMAECSVKTSSFTNAARVFANAGILGEDTVVKAVNFSSIEALAEIRLEKSYSKVRIYKICADGPCEENSLDEPEKIKIQAEEFQMDGNEWKYTLKPYGIYGFMFLK